MNVRQLIGRYIFILCLSLPCVNGYAFSFKKSAKKPQTRKAKREAARIAKVEHSKSSQGELAATNLTIMNLDGKNDSGSRIIMLGQNNQSSNMVDSTKNKIDLENGAQEIDAPIVDQSEGLTEQQMDSDDLIKSESAQESNQQEYAIEKVIDQLEKDDERIEFNFQDADLENLIKQVEDIYELTFITDDIIQPIAAGGKAVKGNKITFQTHEPLTKEGAWNLFITFLDLAGFALVPESQPNTYRIKSIVAAQKSPIPAFIGVDYEQLPDSDEIIRYVYFIQNSTTDAIANVLNVLRNDAYGPLIILQEHKGFVLTDKSYNIKTLMKIVKELDKVSMPQAMSVLKLRRADAQQVKELYDSLIGQENQQTARYFGPRKRSTSIYFPENIKIIAETRTNALVLLGPQDAIHKIEEFIIKNVDVELDKPYSGMRTYQLKYADAATIAGIMNSLAQFGQKIPAGQSGGVRGEDKYLKLMTFTPEPSTNQLIITGEENDYLMAKKILDRLDEPQKQVAIEVLILSVELNKNKELGTQIRSKEPGPDGLLGKNIKFQTSGLRRGGAPAGIVENPDGQGVQRLLGDLIRLVTGGQAGPGNTILTLGADSFGVWGIFQALQTISNAQIVSNPFLVATNKTAATVAVGDERRVVSSTIQGTQTAQSFTTDEAKLQVKITPQITSDGFILLDLDIQINDFINPLDPTSAEKNERQIITKTIIADKEVLALGGLIRNRIEDSLSKTPLFGDIPIIGWLFKNKRKAEKKENLLILISTRIVEPQLDVEVREFTKGHIQDYESILSQMHDVSERRDPINNAFFAQKEGSTSQILDDFLFKREKAERKRNKAGRPVKINDEVQEENGQLLLVEDTGNNDINENKKLVNHTSASLKNPSDKKNTIQQSSLHEKIKEKNRSKLALTDFLSEGNQVGACR